MNINEIGQRAHENAKAKGFYEVPPTIKMRLLLIHSEISEACEAHRKGKIAHVALAGSSLKMVDPFFQEFFENGIKSTFWDEIADVVIRCADFAASEGVTLDINKIVNFKTEDITSALNDLHDFLSSASTSFATGHRIIAFSFIENVIEACIQLAEAHGVDLESHIIAKMRYNAMRPHKHGGKAY